MVTPRSHILAEDEVKPKPPELWAGSDYESCRKGQPWSLHRVESSSMCSLLFFPSQNSSLIPTCTFLTVLWAIRFPRTDHYAIIFEVTFEYNPVQDLALQTCLQKCLAAFP